MLLKKMNVETEIEIECRIQEEMELIRADLAECKEGAVSLEALDGTVGRLSKQDSMMQQEMAKAAQSRRLIRLRMLEEAAARIDEGCYGLCLDCGEEISEARLLEIPETTLCVNCR